MGLKGPSLLTCLREGRTRGGRLRGSIVQLRKVRVRERLGARGQHIMQCLDTGCRAARRVQSACPIYG